MRSVLRRPCPQTATESIPSAYIMSAYLPTIPPTYIIKETTLLTIPSTILKLSQLQVVQLSENYLLPQLLWPLQLNLLELIRHTVCYRQWYYT